MQYPSILSAAVLSIQHDVSPKTFQGMDPGKLASYILGTVFALCRIVGAVTLIWGIYGYITARKSGEANEISIAMIKIVFGVVLIWMPLILRALKIINIG